MPQLICADCRTLTSQAYNFKGNCKKADDVLKLFLATGNFRRPFSRNDYQNSLPKGMLRKLQKVSEYIQPPTKIIKKEPHFDTDSQNTPNEGQEDDQPLEEFEIRLSSNNEYDVTLTSTSKKRKIEDVKSVPTDCFPCTECDRSFPLKQLLDIHLDYHSRSRNFECDECERAFFNKYDLAKHKETHNAEEKNFACVVCNKEFSRESNLHRHEKTHEDVAKLSCSYCPSSFLSEQDLVVHTRKKHGKRKPFPCDKCGKSFVFKQGLERHIAIHIENKPHKCNYCEASFTSPIKLTRHVTSHAGLRPYPCKLCKRTFLLSHHLTRHMRSHYASKSIGQHKCDICSMSFRRKDSLINHSAIHSMVNLKCVICYTEFSNAQAVKDHIATHLSGLPFPCEKCDYSFETKEQLEEHEVKHAEMEYEEQIEKEVVQEARAKGHVQETSENDAEDFDEFGGDHMGRGGEDDDDYQDDEDYTMDDSMRDQTSLRRSSRTPKAKEYVDFLKDEIESDEEEISHPKEEQTQEDEKVHQTADADEDYSAEEGGVIKPIFRTEGTKVYQRRTPVRKPKIISNISTDKVKTAPLSQINQPQVTTIENLGLTTQDLQDLPTEKFVNMKIGNKTVRVQKLVLTKEEMKTMAKEGKIRGNTVLIKNPGQLSNVSASTSVNKADIQAILNESSESLVRPATKTYKKKTVTQKPSNANVPAQNALIINDMIIENLDEQLSSAEVVSIDMK
ncbi:hypothetical protein WA026_011455 [Henosepilachna vigintioctopunctata]